MTVLKLGTRRSALAVTQSTWVADRLRALGLQIEIVTVVTEGDINPAPLTQIGGTGVFASALRQALRAGEIDFAVHSLKDIPVAPEPGLVIAAYPEREDPRDVLIARDQLTLATLPAGARIGTGSPRRAAQLHDAFPHLELVPIRGNVDTRLRRVDESTLDGVILARAGMTRLGLVHRATECLDTDVMVPAAGQGALAVEACADRREIIDALAVLDHHPTRTCVTAERAVLATLEAGCTAPIGVLATPLGQEDPRTHDDAEDFLELKVYMGPSQEQQRPAIRRSAVGPYQEPLTLGHTVAQEILAAVPTYGTVAASSVAAEPTQLKEEQRW